MSLSREKVNHLSQILTQGLGDLPDVTFQAPTNTIRLEIVRAINDALKLEEAIDTAVRRTLLRIRAKLSKAAANGMSCIKSSMKKSSTSIKCAPQPRYIPLKCRGSRAAS